MGKAFIKAIDFLCKGDKVLLSIISVTLRMSILSSIIALIFGIITGMFFATTNFNGKRFLLIINRTLMGLPPVVCGLICFILFCGVGPFRHMHLLYTISAMVIAQVILITPIVVGVIESYMSGIYPNIRATCIGLGISRYKTFLLLINECKYQVITTYLMAFSRAIAEVGAVSMVGGAIAYKTNVMTTAIMNYTNMGNFEMALALGFVLLLISFVINLICNFIIKK